MGVIKSIEAGKRGMLAALFGDHRRHRMLIDSMIEGYIAGFGQGTLSAVLADSETHPKVTQFSMEGYALFGGDSAHPVARTLVEKIDKTVRGETWEGEFGVMLVPETDDWRDLFVEVHGDRLVKKQVVEFSAASLDLDYLRKLSTQVPEGFEIKRFDLAFMRRLEYDINRQGMGFVPLRKFAKHGICYRVVKASDDEDLAAEAFSYVACRAGMEVSIWTESDYRRKGLATAVGATFMLACLEQGLEAHWTTYSNPRSNGLAKKLGYTPKQKYEAFHLPFQKHRRRMLTFVNASNRSVDVYRVVFEQPDEEKYWVRPDFEGELKEQFSLTPGERKEVETRPLFRWRILDAESRQPVGEDILVVEKAETISIP